MSSLCPSFIRNWGKCETEISEQTNLFSQKIASFQSNHSALITDVQKKALGILSKNFSQNKVKIDHPRDIHSFYHALTVATNEVAKTFLSSMKSDWDDVLQSLHQRKIYRVGHGEIKFDITIAKQIIENGLSFFQQRISVDMIDLQNVETRKKVIDYIYKTDREAFGNYFGRGFIWNLLKSKDVLCIAARNNNGEIVGILWGFFTRPEEGTKLFHFWELSRKASMACMGIAQKLIGHAKSLKSRYPDLQFATLNVNHDNPHAKEIYDRESFGEYDPMQKAGEKIFMLQSLASDENHFLSPQKAKSAVRNFVMRSVPLYKLIFFECIRRGELIWRKIRYR